MTANYLLGNRPVIHYSAGGGTVIQGLFRFGLPQLIQPPRPAIALHAHAHPRAAVQPHAAARHPRAPQIIARPANGVSAVPLPAALSNLRTSGAGERLPAPVQRTMETLFRADFSDVRIHVGPQPASLGAAAFTHGTHLYFAAGQYNPATPTGRRLLGHELTHVLQQRAGRVRNPFGSGVAVVQDPALEAEAERMGVRAAAAAPAVQAQMEPDGRDSPTLRPGMATRNISHLFRKTGGKEKDIYMLGQGQAAAVSKTGDLRRIQTEVSTLHDLTNHGVPTIRTSDVTMFKHGDRVSPGFVLDWIPNTIDSNADPAGFRAAMTRLRPEKRRTAARDLDKIQRFVNRHGGIMDLQVLLESTGRLRVLDPRGETEDTSGSLRLIEQWRKILD